MCNWMVTSGQAALIGFGEYTSDICVEDCKLQFRIICGVNGSSVICSGLSDSASMRPIEYLVKLGEIEPESELQFKTLQGWVPCAAIH